MIKESVRRAVIVDAYSTGVELSSELRRYGIESVHVQSMPEILPYDQASFRRNDFGINLVFRDDLNALVAAVAPLEPEFVIAGCESGVQLADQLSERLGVWTNGTSLSDVRRNKARMAERLHECGIPAARVVRVESVGQAEWAANQIGEWPLVLKPVDSAGSDGIYFCDDLASLRMAIGKQLGQINEMGTRNDTLLVMEFLRGQQYVVNGVSRDGEHYTGEIWRDDRRRVPGAGVINDHEVLLPSHGHEQDRLREYAYRCLDAFGVRFGPSYLEIIMTSRGPILVEGASRMMGTQDTGAILDATGQNAVTLCAMSYATPDERWKILTSQPYELKRQVAVVATFNTQHGCVTHDRWLDELRSRPSFRSIRRGPQIGDVLRPTTGLSSCYGLIYLVGDDPSVLDADYRFIRNMENRRGGFFELET